MRCSGANWFEVFLGAIGTTEPKEKGDIPTRANIKSKEQDDDVNPSLATSRRSSKSLSVNCQKDAFAAVTLVPSSGLLRLPPSSPSRSPPTVTCRNMRRQAPAGSVSRSPWSKYLTVQNEGEVRSGQVNLNEVH